MADLTICGPDAGEQDGAGTPVRVTVRNLSPGGMMVERDLPVRRGARVAIETRALGRVAGVVVWVRAPLFGIAFESVSAGP